MATTSQADYVAEWRFTIARVDANAVELAPAQNDRVQLEAVLVRVEEAKQRQKFHQFQFQQASRDLDAAIAEGRVLHTKIRNFIRAIFGLLSEKLVEFKLKPRRRATGESKKKKPAEVGPTQPQPATPETDGAIQK
ncbi:MAG TPA: hypothetical protein VF414_09465 [Thermoanaerobaculia bacterium]